MMKTVCIFPQVQSVPLDSSSKQSQEFSPPFLSFSEDAQMCLLAHPYLFLSAPSLCLARRRKGTKGKCPAQFRMRQAPSPSYSTLMQQLPHSQALFSILPYSTTQFGISQEPRREDWALHPEGGRALKPTVKLHIVPPNSMQHEHEWIIDKYTNKYADCKHVLMKRK